MIQTLTLAAMPKGWFVPATPEAYDTLKRLGIPMLLISKDYMGTLELALRRKKIKLETVTFWQDILLPRIDRVGTAWNERPGHTATIEVHAGRQSTMDFVGPHDERTRKLIAKLEAKLAEFFLRWGVKFYSDFSEKGAKYKLTVAFQFNGDTVPMMPTLVQEPKTIMSCRMGFSLLRFTFYEKQTDELRKQNIIAPSIQLEVCTQAGSEWVVVHSTTFRPQEIGDLTPMIGAVGMLMAKAKIEDDRK